MGDARDIPTGPTPYRRALSLALDGKPDWNPRSRSGETTIEAQSAITLLSGDTPWLPGVTFAADPLLAAYLRACLRNYTPAKRDQVLAGIKALP